jgi:four helix bundle protein
MPRYDLEERLLNFAAEVIRLTRTLERSYAGQHIAQQLLRSGTSPLANHGEGESAKSRRDFIHRLRTCLQELREAYRWLKLIERVPLTEDRESLGVLIKESDELIRIFVASIRTAEEHGRE